MSECRALTNLVGNGVATIVIARWEGDLDREKLAYELAKGPDAPPDAHRPTFETEVRRELSSESTAD